MLPLNDCLISNINPKSSISESFRLMRTFFRNKGFKKTEKGKILMVCSANEKEGKTTILANLAVSLAQDGLKVIMIDCHLRSPTLHLMFNLPNTKGITKYMKTEYQFKEFVLPTMVSNLYLLPAGGQSAESSEILGSSKMADLLNELKQEYDVILLDSPAVLSFTDALVLVEKCDGTALVVKSGVTKREAVQKMRSMIELAGGMLSGVILNQNK